MKKISTKHIVKYKSHELPLDNKTDWARIDAMTFKEVEKNALSDPDSLLADEEFWETAQLVMPTEKNKERITLRLDADVLQWLKKQGRGYQSRINAILRAFMKTAKKHPSH